MEDLTFLRPLVANILQDDRREWTVQGFGFLRTYFGPADAPKKFRLNLWHSKFTVPNVSTIHDHPWNLKSVIIAGQPFTNLRYKMRTHSGLYQPTHSYMTIKTGIGGGVEQGEIYDADLVPGFEEEYRPGDIYRQQALEVHETKFVDGAVTLNERIGDTERARVFWPYGTDWVDAIPRAATREEVTDAVLYSLGRWF